MGTRQNFTVLHVATYHSLRGGWDDPNCAQYSTHPALSAPRRALSRARAFQFPIPPFRGVAMAALNCAHRTSTVSPCAFCEQGGHLAAPPPILLRPRVARARGSSQLPRPFSPSCYIRSIRIVGTSITRRSTKASPIMRPITLTRSAGTGSCPILIGVRPKKMAKTCPAPQKATSPTLT